MLTKKGHQSLVTQFEELSKTERPRVVKGVADAAAEGDRSENAEYIYGKKKLREIDKRLSYLSNLLKDTKIIDPAHLDGDIAQFGSTVVIEDEEGVRKTWTIVGEGEASIREGTISYRAPVAKALLGRSAGEYVSVERPAGKMEYEIVEVRHGDVKDTEMTA